MHTNEYKNNLINQISTELDNMNLKYSINENNDLIHFAMKNDEIFFRVRILVDKFGLRIYCFRDEKIPKDCFNKITEYIAYLNWTMKFGGFEFNKTQDRFRFKIYMALSESDFKKEMSFPKTITRCIRVAFEAMQKYEPGVTRIINNPELDVKKVAEEIIYSSDKK